MCTKHNFVPFRGFFFSKFLMISSVNFIWENPPPQRPTEVFLCVTSFPIFRCEVSRKASCPEYHSSQLNWGANNMVSGALQQSRDWSLWAIYRHRTWVFWEWRDVCSQAPEAMVLVWGQIEGMWLFSWVMLPILQTCPGKDLERW